MKIEKGLLFAAYSIVFFSFSASAENKVELLLKSSENLKRCNAVAVSPYECAASQREALKSKCLTKEEYDYAVKENVLPLCGISNKLLVVCSCGCFASETKIMVDIENKRQKLSIFGVVEKKIRGIWTFDEEGTMTDPRYKRLEIVRSTRGPETNPLLYISTNEGKTIGLTQTHAVLLSNGEMVPAQSLSIGQELVNYKGRPEKITKIIQKTTAGDVFNLLSSGKSHLSHLIIAEGLVVGDLAWQNSLSSELYATHVRK